MKDGKIVADDQLSGGATVLELWRHAGQRTVRSVRDLVGVAVAGLTARGAAPC